MAPPPPPIANAKMAYAQDNVNSEAGAEAPVQRRIAHTHSMNIKTTGDDLAKRFEQDAAECAKLGCELINSSISENYGSINARISPAKLDAFLKFLSRKGAKISEHSLNSEDKTVEYIDTDSRIRTSEALKTRLTTLLATTESKDLKAIIEIEKELARVQQEIDSAKSVLKYLSTITSMVTVNINYSAEYETGAFDYKGLKNSFRYAWQGFVQNIAYVIEFIGKSLPWIPVILLGVWILRKAIRFKRKNKDEAK